jgi:hypothetical protein
VLDGVARQAPVRDRRTDRQNREERQAGTTADVGERSKGTAAGPDGTAFAGAVVATEPVSSPDGGTSSQPAQEDRQMQPRAMAPLRVA